MEKIGVNIRLATNSSNEFLQQAIVRALPYANKQMEIYKNSLTPEQNIRAAQILPKILGINYKADSWKNQNIQLPSSLINTKEGDCKSFALLIAGYLQANNVRNGVVFVGYGKGATQPTHIYNFAILDGKQYWIDGTLPVNRIPANRAKETIQIEVMNTNLIARSYENELGQYFDEDIAGKKERQERRDKRRAEGKGFGQKVKKVGLAPARGALLALIAINVHGLATRMQKGYKKNPKALEGLWKKVGGKLDKLLKAVNTGAKKKRILGADLDAGLGVVATTTLLASAAPILVAVAKLLKDLKVEEEPGADLAALIPEGTEPLGAEFEVTDPDTGKDEPTDRSSKSSKKEKSGGFEVGTPVLLGSAALLLLLLTNK